MSHFRNHRTPGFALIEALIALVLIAIGLVAVSKLQTLSLFGSGDGRARAEAANFSQQKLEELRNVLRRGDFTALASGEADIPGSNGANSFKLVWTVTPDPDAAIEQHLVQLSTTWTDARGDPQQLDLNSVIAWDDPGANGKLPLDTAKTLISPTGEALRGDGVAKVPGGAKLVSTNHDKTMIYTDGDKTGKTYLARADGTIILYLNPTKDGTALSFARISGRIVIDADGFKLVPDPAGKVFVRLSSEGECIYDNSNTIAVAGVANSKYFDYTCYVGPGWFGNVGVSTQDAGGKDPAICVGDPGYNAGAPDGTTVSPDARRSATRTYRGYHTKGGIVLSAGMYSGGRYGTTLDQNGDVEDGAPFNGKPVPSALAGFAVKPAPGDPDDYLRQDFLLTDMSGDKELCAAKMPKTAFQYNAGRHVCISPNETGGSDCPQIWPGFDAQGANVGACTIEIAGGVKAKNSSVSVAFKTAPGTPIPECLVSKGTSNYECTIAVPDDALGSAIVLSNLDNKDAVIGSVELALPAVCPDASSPPITHNFN